MDAQDWDERYAEKPRLWSEEPNRFVAEELEGLEPGSALDLACGEGRNAVWLAEKGWEVTGVDFSAVALARAHRMAGDREVEVDWVVADILDWDPGRRFDLVLVAYVHLPLRERMAAMQKAVSWVAPGGYLLLVGHDVSTVGVSGPPNPELLWDPERAAEAVRSLQVVKSERRARETDAGEMADDTVLLAYDPR